MMACCTQGALCSSSRRSRCDLPEPELPCTRRRVASSSSRSMAAAAPAVVCPISIATVMSRLKPYPSRKGAYQPDRSASSGTGRIMPGCPRRSSGVIRQIKKGRSIGRVGIVVVVIRDGAGPEFLPDPLDLGDALVQPMQVVLRFRSPESKGVGSEREKRRSEQRRIGNDGSSEQEKPVGAGHDKGRIAAVSDSPDPVQ